MRRRTLLAAAGTGALAMATGTSSNAAAQPGRPAIFVVPHPDDETIAAGVTIAEHVIAGRDVHILFLTRGSKSTARAKINGTGTGWWGVQHNPAMEGYAPLTEEQFGAARYREGLAAVNALGVAEDHVHEAGLIDQTVTVAQAKAAIVGLADQIGGDVGLWAPSWLVDDNPDHIAAGQAVKQLGVEDPVRWHDRRYYILTAYWSGDPRLPQVTWWFDQPASTEVRNRAINACRTYQAWQPRAGAFAIGYHSVPAMFDVIDQQPRCLVHS